ncbi:hypothetical protein FA15DRAFT_665299 [Coprinopsis marcescibilis]|uniref:Uncharacterized protein n=1 Tax=Coprinopsis marcescibilis TaxID=230819 RepID=A0A5C3L7F2_COPMA|nr:hypothetical protein FA15DRAFT_665299 [Coprinopsis marcescibilis]
MSHEISALGPIDPSSVANHEDEKEAPWIMRKLVGSMTGRIVLSSYESVRAAGTSVVCLSPWGDSSPLLLPCIRFRDLAVHTVIAATGGMAAVAAPVMVPVSEAAVATFGSTIIVEMGLSAGFSLTTKVANDLVFSKPINKLVPIHSARLQTTGVKVLTITLKNKLAMEEDAALGFYRGSSHKDSSLFSSVKEYLAIEKGWFSPYLFASARRPIIPRTLKPDIVFCHGPFLSGDYSVGETLLKESDSVIVFWESLTLPSPENGAESEDKSFMEKLSIPALSNLFNRSRSSSPDPALAPIPPPPVPRRMVILVLGLKPFRQMWTSSKRPGESVLKYVLLNGCISVVVPVKTGSPLIAWDTMTLEKLWAVELPSEGSDRSSDGKFEGVVGVIWEYIDLCVDWERISIPNEGQEEAGEESLAVPDGDEDSDAGKCNKEPDQPAVAVGLGVKKQAVKDAVTLLVAGAVRSKKSEEVRDELDEDRSGIAMWRIP